MPLGGRDEAPICIRQCFRERAQGKEADVVMLMARRHLPCVIDATSEAHQGDLLLRNGPEKFGIDQTRSVRQSNTGFFPHLTKNDVHKRDIARGRPAAGQLPLAAGVVAQQDMVPGKDDHFGGTRCLVVPGVRIDHGCCGYS